MTFQTYTGIEYLQIDIANNFGYDKLTWDERIAWTQANEYRLEDLTFEADAPALYHASVQALRAAQNGSPSGYAVSLDATASGAQLLAILAGCEASMSLCNVVDTGHREDLYTNIYQFMLEEIGEEAKITRSDVKSAVMTSLYGSTAQPVKIFGKGKLLDIFYKTMETRAPGCWSLNQGLINLWQPYTLSHDWILPDNFHVHVPVMERKDSNVHFLNEPIQVSVMENCGTKSGLSIGANLIHSIDGMIVREMAARCMYDRDHVINLIEMLLYYKDASAEPSTNRPQDKLVKILWDHYLASGFLSARILDALDAKNMTLVDRSVILRLLNTLPEAPFEVLSVHDCFRCLPNYGNDLRKTYNQILFELSGSNILAYLAGQIVGQPVTLPAKTFDHSKILEANYALS
jgi:hypothetical protein